MPKTEYCYVCGVALKALDDYVVLKDEDGLLFLVHATCTDQLEKVEEP